MRLNMLLAGSLLFALSVHFTVSPNRVVAQYSAVIANRPPASVTMGSYSAALQQRAAQTSYRSSSHGGHYHGGHHHGHHVHWGHRHHGHGYHGGYSTGLYVNNFIDFGGYNSSPYGYGYGFGYPPYYLDTGFGSLGPYVLPPIYVPAEQLGYGPQAIRSFMGLDPVQQPIVNRTIVIAPPQAGQVNPAPPQNGNAVVDRLAVRVSNAEARARSAKFIEFGDVQFAAIRPLDALDRYKKAAEAAPDMLVPHFRQGFILAHMQRYDQAARAFRRGLDLQPEPDVEPHVSIQQLYGDNRAARNALLARLSTATAEQAAGADVHFTAGVVHYFDGNADLSRAAFRQARQLGEPAQYVDGFLKQLGDAKEPEKPAVELDI